MEHPRRIFVVGSLNMDLLQSVPRLPSPGETLIGGELQTNPGGKGANQARAAARLGAAVVMIGKVGNDDFGRQLRASLRDDGVDVERIRVSGHATGTAIVFLLPNGENVIVIAPGANADLQPADIADGLSELQAGDLLLCQLETPLDTVHQALRIARERHVTTILDPAPAADLSPELLNLVDILTPNETEAAHLAPSGDIDALAQLTGGTIIRKQGSAGCTALVNSQTIRIPAFQVNVVDTTAAGDTFNGALAVALSRNEQLPSALHFATAAAALSVTRQGASASAPTAAELQAFLASHTIDLPSCALP